MPRHFGKTHEAKQPMQLQGLGMGKLYERKAVGSHRVLRGDWSRRDIMWEWTHVNSFLSASCRPSAQSACLIAFRNAGPLSLWEEPGTGFALRGRLTHDEPVRSTLQALAMMHEEEQRDALSNLRGSASSEQGRRAQYAGAVQGGAARPPVGFEV
jgi:hypothetical protein